MKNNIFKTILIAKAVLICSLIFNSCKPKNTDILPNPESTAGQFLNLNAGSTWEYITDGSANTTIVTVIDSAKIAFTKNYKVFHSTTLGVTTSNYYTFKNGNYYLLTPSTTLGLQELVYLKDSAEVGKKWTSTVSPSGTAVAYNYEIKENGLTKIINGTTYTNVVHVKLTVPISGYTADTYYAPKVGLIKSDAVTSGVTSITELKSYTLK